jgi:phage-related protein
MSEAYLENFEVFEEGANIEITKKAREFYKGFKTDIKAAKAAIKKGDKAAAKSNLKQARTKLSGFKKEVQNMDSTAGSAIFGWFTSGLVSMARDAAFIFGTFGISFATTNVLSALTFKQIMGAVLNAGERFIANISAIGLKAASIATYIYGIYDLITKIIKITKSIDKGDKAADALNLYRVEMLKTCDKFDKVLSKLEGQL